jgi:23S rRNA (cytidine2498-2'-O)-methyltransferase
LSDFIFTSQDDSWELAMNELLSYLSDSELMTWLVRGIGIMRSPLGFSEVSQQLLKNPPIFTRHIFPLDHVTPINGWESAIAQTISRLRPKSSFNVQVRILDPTLYAFSKFDLTQWISEELQKGGFWPDMQTPDFIVSIIAYNFAMYIGLSEPSQNMSSWPGGMRRFARRDDQISRAEFKLLEALEVFSIDLSSFSMPEGQVQLQALDLGAAPGSWSKALADRDFFVTAVDPANLSPLLKGNKNIVHYPYAVQKFMSKDKKSYSLIANDMRMDVGNSAKIMVSLAPKLASDGIAVMTFKLPEKKPLAAMNKGMQILESGYENLRAKQLFHNRSEITVTGNRKST